MPTLSNAFQYPDKVECGESWGPEQPLVWHRSSNCWVSKTAWSVLVWFHSPPYERAHIRELGTWWRGETPIFKALRPVRGLFSNLSSFTIRSNSAHRRSFPYFWIHRNSTYKNSSPFQLFVYEENYEADAFSNDGCDVFDIQNNVQ
jgi:hypothetical protein